MPKLKIDHRRHCLLSTILFFISLLTYSQGKLLDVTRTSSIDAVTKEEITNLRVGNLTEILRFAPGTHHLNSRVTTVDYDDPLIDKRVDRILYDGKNEPAYIQSTSFAVTGETISAIEQVWRDNKLVQGYRWSNFNNQPSASLYDLASDKYLPQNFEPKWEPKFIYVPPTSGEIVDFDASEYIKRLTAERNQATGALTVDDDTYGDGGKAELDRRLDPYKLVKEEKIFDARGVLREYRYKEIYPDDYMYEEVTYYDCNGQRIYFESTLYDDEDYEVEMVDLIYQNGMPVAGIRDVDDFDEEGPIEFRHYFNFATQKFEPKFAAWDYDEYMFDMADQLKPCDYPSYFSVGARLIIEDSYPERFNTYGGYASYTHMLGKHWGITGDIGVTVGSNYDWDYTKINIVAGPTFFPCDHASFDDPFSVNAHLYVGLSSITSKYEMGTSTTKNSESYFTSVIGVDGFYNLNRKYSIKAGANLNLNFASGNTNKNYQFDLGLTYRF